LGSWEADGETTKAIPFNVKDLRGTKQKHSLWVGGNQRDELIVDEPFVRIQTVQTVQTIQI